MKYYTDIVTRGIAREQWVDCKRVAAGGALLPQESISVAGTGIISVPTYTSVVSWSFGQKYAPMQTAIANLLSRREAWPVEW